ncbi:MAG: restriction endonuclease subunit S [Bacteroidetes bacterium]|nr:restriction endonuclease subunit S [Bacteroidota bacterium]
MSEWRDCNLKDVLGDKGYIRGPFGSALKRGEMKKVGVPVYEQKNAIYGERKFRYFIDDEKFEELKRFQVETNDLIISCSGTVGKISIITENDPKGIISQALLILRPNTKNIDLLFLYYFLSSKKGLNLLTQVSHGSVQINIAARKIVETIPLYLPPLPEQKAIAGVLSSLDDKIDLLHRQNKTLEAMAETLFRQWFVEEAEEDWKLVKLGDFVTMNKLSLKKNSNILEIKYLDTSSLTEGKINDLQYLLLKQVPSRAKRLVKHNDILISTVRPNQKHYGIIRNPDNNLIVSTGYCVITCNKINPYFVYVFLTTSEMTEYLHSIAEGSTSTYPSLKPEDLKKLEFHNPRQETLDDFSVICHGFWNKIERNYLQISILENLRDNLLPKFMSGEVRVKI